MKIMTSTILGFVAFGSIASASPAQVEICVRVSKTMSVLDGEIKYARSRVSSAPDAEVREEWAKIVAEKQATLQILDLQYTQNQCDSI